MRGVVGSGGGAGRRSASIALLLGAALALSSPALAHAQEPRPAQQGSASKKAARGKRAREKPARKSKQKAAEAAARDEAEKQRPEREAATAEAQADGATHPDAAAEVVTEEDGSQVKVMEFSGLDIEGQLKTPQMLYFLNRLRAEFGRPRLPHRSFMPELQRGTQEDSVR